MTTEHTVDPNDELEVEGCSLKFGATPQDSTSQDEPEVEGHFIKDLEVEGHALRRAAMPGDQDVTDQDQGSEVEGHRLRR